MPSSDPEGARPQGPLAAWRARSYKPALFRLTGSDSPLFVSIDPAVAMMGPDAASLMVTLLPSGPVATASPAGASYAVGGQMVVTAGTPPGSYAGQYNISFEYQ